MRFNLPLTLLLVGLIPNCYVNAQAPFAGELAGKLVDAAAAEVCPKLEPLPETGCKEILLAAAESSATGSVDLDELKKTLKVELGKPDFLNSALLKAYGGPLPLGLEFKALDAADGNSMLGLTYEIDYNFIDKGASGDGNWNKRYAVAFDATGTLTQNSEENPRNFLETKLVASGSYSTRIPKQSIEFATRLTEFALADAACEEDETSEECQAARTTGFEMLDSTSEFLKAFQYYEFGLDMGFESDQDFDAQQRKVGAYVYGQYESWGSNSLLGTINLSPAVRLGVDSVAPNSSSPRALAGDDSSFYRVSGEISLWIPLETRIPMAFTVNYRYYREIGPSGIVKEANLDEYSLITVSLTGTNGLFASYSSGKLPLDLQNQDVVELGWKTYF